MSLEPNDVGDAISGIAVIGVLADVLPQVAALAAIIWTVIRIYEYARWKLGYVKEEHRFK